MYSLKQKLDPGKLTAQGQLILLSTAIVSIPFWYGIFILLHWETQVREMSSIILLTNIVASAVINSHFSFEAERRKIEKEVNKVRADIPRKRS